MLVQTPKDLAQPTDHAWTEAAAGTSLDPSDWTAIRALGHRMLDDVFDDLQGIADGPVWQPMPDAVRGAWSDPLPRDPSAPEAVYDSYRSLLAPYAVGNRHP